MARKFAISGTNIKAPTYRVGCNNYPCNKANSVLSQPLVLKNNFDSKANIQNEIEARFFVHKSELQNELISFKKLKIRQFYISENRHSEVINSIISSNPEILPMVRSGLNTVRLRAQHAEGQSSSYFVQLKTKKESLSQVEISIAISRELFKSLLTKADDGFVSKTRLMKSAYCEIAGKFEKIEVHIDLITALGLGKNKLAGNNLPKFLAHFAIAEIELPSEDAYFHLKSQQWGIFSFLSKAINLQEVKVKSKEKISFRALPRGKESKSEMQRIFEIVRKAA